MVPPKVSRSTMAAQSLGSVKVLVQPEKDSFSHLARVWTSAGSMLGLALKSKPRRDFSRGTWRP
jgi:hypothetical protein